MPSYQDPALDDQMQSYLDHNEDPKYLYHGTREDITKKLQDWIERRKQIYRLLMAVRGRCLDQSEENLRRRNRPDYPQADHHDFVMRGLPLASELMKLADGLDIQDAVDSGRASYLLKSLLKLGVSWPCAFPGFARPTMSLKDNPMDGLFYDGHVCSFLSTVDPTFDAPATYHVLEDEDNERRLKDRAARRDVEMERLGWLPKV